MKRALPFPQIMLFGIPLAIVLSMVYLVQSSTFQLHPELSYGITLDLIFTVPVVYFLIIRKRDIPNYTVFSVFILSLVLASCILPLENQQLLSQIKFIAIPVVELTVFSIVFYKIYRITQAYKKKYDDSIDFYSTISTATKEIMPPRLAPFLATEIAVGYYAFFGWGTRTLKKNEYSYHRKSGIVLVLGVLIAMVFAETFVFHLLIEKWSTLVAWIATGLSIYTAFQIFALIRSFKHRPILINTENKTLQLRYGFFSETTIQIDDIEKIQMTSRSLSEKENMVQFSPLGMIDTHNIVLHLKNENEMNGFYGLKKKYQVLAIYVDEKNSFKEQLNNLMCDTSRDRST